MPAIDLGQRDSDHKRAEEGVESKVFRACRPQEAEQNDARDGSRWLGQMAMNPLHHGWQHEAAHQHDSADVHKHHAKDRNALPLGGRVGAEFRQDHREQSPAHQIVHQRRRHDRPADVALEEAHVHQDPRDHGIRRQ